MTTEVSIRPAATGDLEGIQRVARRAWRETYEGILSEDSVETMLDTGYSTEVLDHILDSDSRALFVAVDVDETVGYASSGESAVPLEGEASIYLDPDWWGRGLGEALLARLEEDLADRNVRHIREHVLAANDVGNAFYAKHFQKTDERDIEIGGESHTANVYTREIE